MPTLQEAIAGLPMDAINVAGGADDQTLASAAGRTVVDFTPNNVDVDIGDALYDSATGDIDCSGLNIGQEIMIRWHFDVDPTNTNAQFIIEVICPASPDVVMYKREYLFLTTDLVEFANTTAFFVNQDVISHGLQLRVSNPGTQSCNIEGRSLYVRVR